MRLDAEGAARQGEDEVAVDFGCGVGRDHDAVLLGERGDAQGLGEAGGAGRIELDVADAAQGDEIAHREAGQLALAMRQGDRRRRGEPGEIGGLQIPVQRLLEPEDAMRLDPVRELDAVGQIVGRVHVEQQVGVAQRGAHRADPRRLGRDAAGAGLELDRAIAEIEKPRQLLAVIGIGGPGR